MLKSMSYTQIHMAGASEEVTVGQGPEPLTHCIPGRRATNCVNQATWMNLNPWRKNQQHKNSRNDTGQPSWNWQNPRLLPSSSVFQNPNWPSTNVWQNQNQRLPPAPQIFFTCTIIKRDGSSLDAAGIEISSFQGERSRGFLVPGMGLYPAYKGGAVLSARDPDTTQGRVNVVTVEVKDRYGKNCQAKCYEPRFRRYVTCRGQFRLSNDRRSADPIQMTGTQREALEGMWVRNGNNMYRLPDYCRFECT
uniref:Uncharacterized protein n=1 Tax=Romanomermis culicivorax TaxID=13658 RepID=A0A915JT29_ROMCU